MLQKLSILFLTTIAASVITSAQISRSDLVGIWRTGGPSTLIERNTVTGSTTPSNGNTLKFEFRADGRFAFIGYLQSTMYGCRTDLFNDKQGRYEVSSGQLTLDLTKNFWRNTYSCSPSSNKERNYKLDAETYDIRTKTDEYGKPFICLTNENGETCYRREKE